MVGTPSGWFSARDLTLGADRNGIGEEQAPELLEHLVMVLRRVACAGRGDELATWPVDAADVAEIEHAIARAKWNEKSVGGLTKEDFPLPTLAGKIDRWRTEIQDGRGFQVLRGVPVARWAQADAELFFWCFGQHLGTPGAQNPQADLLGHVRDTGESPDEVRHYRTRVNINFHCDAADIVGLLCLHKAKRGGQRISTLQQQEDGLLIVPTLHRAEGAYRL